MVRPLVIGGKQFSRLRVVDGKSCNTCRWSCSTLKSVPTERNGVASDVVSEIQWAILEFGEKL
jgi:hypothetical protein